MKDVIICPLCAKKFYKIRTPHHNKSKKHFMMVEIYNNVYKNTTPNQQQDTELIKKMIKDEYINVKYDNKLKKLTEYVNKDCFKSVISCK